MGCRHMFKKLLSNLPFNPSLINQVAFYTQRVKRESAVRRTAFVFMGLALVVQTFAVISPPQSSLAASTNDIVYGGFTSATDAAAKCRANSQNFGTVLAYYGVSCDTVAGADTTTIKSTDYYKQLDSLGRNPQPATNPKNGKPSDQYTVNIPGVSQLYMKNLWYWDTYASSSYKVLQMTNQHGQTVFILYDCGNVVTIGKYQPPAPTPPPPTPPASPKDVCPNKDGVQMTLAECDVCPKIAGTQLTTAECDVCKNIPGEQTSTSQCYPCPEARTNTSETACMQFDKTARNDTQKLANANGTKAQAGDTITYTLRVTNTGSIDIKGFVMTEELNDVLEYADVVDLNGGTMSVENIVSWPRQDIAPKSTLEKQIVVRIKNPVPQTPASSSDPGSYDLVMTNVFYDKSINIFLPETPIKIIEQVTTTLPSTGPGESIAAGFAITVVIAYFFARSRLFASELTIVRQEYANAGDI